MEYTEYINTIILIVILLLMLKKQGAAGSSQNTSHNLLENYDIDIIEDMKIELVNSQNREEQIIKVLPEVQELLKTMKPIIRNIKSDYQEIQEKLEIEQRQESKKRKVEESNNNNHNTPQMMV